MKTHDCYRLHITPLSPVHIGTGESYEPTNYVIDDGVLHEFDTGAVIDALTARDREGLLAIANRKPDAEMIKALQRFFHERKEGLKPWAVNRIPVLPGVANLYASRVGQTAQREGDGGQVVNRLEIDRCAYNSITRKPVLFGSSMKGAIRTALLDMVNNGHSLRKVEDPRTGRMREENNQELQQRLFEGKFELDPLRLIQFADAVWAGESHLPATQVCFAVNRYKKDARDKHGNALTPKTNKGPDQLLECLPSWRYRAFSAQLNIQILGNIPKANHISQRQLPSEDLRFAIPEIAQACNAFYWPIFLRECEIIRQRNYLDLVWDQTAQTLLLIARPLMEKGQAFLLRVGRHSGAESVTLNEVRHIKIMEGKDPQTRKQRFSFADAAKTLWLAADTKDQRTGLLPFGWVLVEIHPLDAPEPDWPELRALCEPHLEQARNFASKLAQEAKKLAYARAQAEQRRREEAEQARKKAEEEARAAREAEEKQARLDAMTENMRKAEDLAARLMPASKGRGKGHQLYQQVNQLIQSAADWTPDEQLALKAAAIKAFEHLGLKKDDYKKLIRELAAN